MKTFEEIYQGMLALFQEKTGFSMQDSADLAVRLQACAAQLEGLYHYADWCVKQAFPQTAVEENLDRHGALRGLSRHAGECAVGQLRFSIPVALEAPLTIEAGVVCCTTGLTRFVTTEEGVIPAGETSCLVSAKAEQPGAMGNADANTVTVLTLAPTGVTACRNPAAFTGGADLETDEHFRARILATYAQLPNGANAAWYRQRCLDHDGVAAVTVVPRVNGVGTVGVVVASGDGLPSEQLLEALRADLAACREIAVDVTVSAPEVVSVAVAGTLTPAGGVGFQEAKTAAEAAVAEVFSGGNLGKSVYRGALIAAIMATGKVLGCDLSSPASDVAVTETQLAMLQSCAFTEG